MILLILLALISSSGRASDKSFPGSITSNIGKSNPINCFDHRSLLLTDNQVETKNVKFSKYYGSFSGEYHLFDKRISDYFPYYGSFVFHLGWKRKRIPTGLELSIIFHNFDKFYYYSEDMFGDVLENRATISSGGVLLTGYYQFSFESFYLNLGFVNALLSMTSFTDDSYPTSETDLKDVSKTQNYLEFNENFGNATAWGFGIATKMLYDFPIWGNKGIAPYLGIRYIFFANGESEKDFRKTISLGGLSFSLGVDLYLKKF